MGGGTGSDSLSRSVMGGKGGFRLSAQSVMPSTTMPVMSMRSLSTMSDTSVGGPNFCPYTSTLPFSSCVRKCLSWSVTPIIYELITNKLLIKN